MSDSEKTTSKRVRSPSYPSLNLQKALSKAQELYRAEGRNAAAVAIILDHWGYSRTSGSGMKTLAALSSFGLVDVSGSKESRRAKLSDLALRIILDDRDDSDERQEAIRKAALSPKIHKKLWTLWGPEFPSFGNMRHHLIFEEKFNENFVDDFIKDYKSTIEFANPAESETDNDEPESNEIVQVEDKEAWEPKPELGWLKRVQTNRPRQTTRTMEIAKYPVGKNLTMSIFVDGPYKRKNIEALMAQLELAISLGTFDDLADELPKAGD